MFFTQMQLKIQAWGQVSSFSNWITRHWEPALKIFYTAGLPWSIPQLYVGTWVCLTFLLCWHLSSPTFYLLFLVVVFVTFLQAEEKSDGWLNQWDTFLGLMDHSLQWGLIKQQRACVHAQWPFPLHPAQRYGQTQCESSYTSLPGRWEYVMTANHSHWAGSYTLWWVSSPLFVKMPFCAETQEGSGHQTLAVSVHISVSFHNSTFSVSVIGAAGFLWQWLSHRQCSLWVTVLWEKYLPKEYRRQVRDASCCVYFTQSHQKEPSTSCNLEWDSLCFDERMGQESFWLNTVRVYFWCSIKDTLYGWKYLFLNDVYLGGTSEEVVSEKLRDKRRMFVWYVPISPTSGTHSKQHNRVEVHFPILAIAKRAEQPSHCLTKEAKTVRGSRSWHIKYKERNLMGPGENSECSSLSTKSCWEECEKW